MQWTMFPKSRVWCETYPKCMLHIDLHNSKYSLHVAQSMDEELRILGCCAAWSGRLTDRACRDRGKLRGAIVHCNDGSIVRLAWPTQYMRLSAMCKNMGGIHHVWVIYGHETDPECNARRLRNLLRGAKYMLFGDGNGGTLGDVERVKARTRWYRLRLLPVFELSGEYTIDDITSMFAAVDGTAPPRDEDQIEAD